MEAAMIEAVHALAIRPELLTVGVLAVVLTVILRRRAKVPSAQKKNGTPIFTLVVNRLTTVMCVLAAVTVIREVVAGLAVIWSK